tara:strand:- start:197 stop:544 length:348 start_codon:yes stop_codon:yes gene_type:complete
MSKRTLGKNIAIAQPKGPSARLAAAKNVGSVGTFGEKENSTVNPNFDSSGGFGAAHNRKIETFTQPEIIKSSFTSLTRQQKENGVRTSSQLRLESNTGSMDRLARLKAAAISGGK